MDLVVDTFKIIFYIISIGFAAFSLLYSKTKARSTQKKAENVLKELVKNQEDQKLKEKELESMAKSMCDKCGKEVAVKDMKRWTGDWGVPEDDNFFVCIDCFNQLEGLTDKLREAENEVAAKAQALDEAKNKLIQIKESMNHAG